MMTQLITAPLTLVTARPVSSQMTACPGQIISARESLTKSKLTLATPGTGIIKSGSKVPVSGVKGNMSYKVTNTFITHLTGVAVKLIC